MKHMKLLKDPQTSYDVLESIHSYQNFSTVACQSETIGEGGDNKQHQYLFNVP